MARRSLPSDVEIPITPMLDMAFQLLAFFVMTFNPMPVEVQYTMNLLPGKPVAQPEAQNDNSSSSDELPAELKTITTNLYSDSAGNLARVTIGENEIEGMDALRAKIKAMLSDKDVPFDQAMIVSDPALHYGEIMRVIDIFNSENITKISFSELNANGIAL
ncbi:MAG TPA: biopolymer transporter ExbD [Isosphaeraceae bacterium]|nr:biopolymer transporter ExbD [Isosphaeraceae bacterium]